MFNVKIFSTGSEGNCIQIDNVLIDIGLTKKKLTNLGVDFDSITDVFVTHKHGDHYNDPLFRYLQEEDKKMYISQDTFNSKEIALTDNLTIYEESPKEIVIGSKKYPKYKCGELTVIPVPQKHFDIVNYALVIEKGDYRLLYSTDLDTLSPSDLGDGLLHLGMFDTILLEGNYDEHYLRQYIGEHLKLIHADLKPETMTDEELESFVKGRYKSLPKELSQLLFRAVQNMRHLSKEQARSYVRQHLKESGQYFEIHRSSKFYER